MKKFLLIVQIIVFLILSIFTIAASSKEVVQDPVTHYLSNVTLLRTGEKLHKVEFDANGDGLKDIFLIDDTFNDVEYFINLAGYLSDAENGFLVANGGPAGAGGNIYPGNKIRLKRNNEGKLCFYSDNLIGQDYEMVQAYLVCATSVGFERVIVRILDLRDPMRRSEPLDNTEDFAWAETFVSQFDMEVPIKTIDVETHSARRERTGPFFLEKEYLESPYRLRGPPAQITDEMSADTEKIVEMEGIRALNISSTMTR